MKKVAIDSFIASSGEQRRYWKIDFLRGIAVLMMIVFHILYDLYSFGSPRVRSSLLLPRDFWFYSPKIIGGLFFLILGISAWLRFRLSPEISYSSFAKRGIQILLIALCISVVTALISSKTAIYFGVLHGIGTSFLLIYPFLKRFYLNLLLGTVLAITGVALWQYRFDEPYFLWLGLIPKTGTGADYYPLLPWFGVILIGIFLGKIFYPIGKSDYAASKWTPFLQSFFPIRVMTFVGRHSLLIYLVHQPLILAILYITGITQVRH